MSSEIRVLVVDDHKLFRDSFVEKLSIEPDIEVVASAANADEALERAFEFRPKIVLMDVDMPGLGCFEAAKRMVARFPDINVIFVSAYTHDAYIEQALTIKARGYVSKRDSFENLVQAVREVAAGGVYYSEDVRARMVIGPQGAQLREGQVSRRTMLSPRELEVLGYIARGMTKKEIAAVMHLSCSTVDNHTTRLMTKLDIHSRVDLAKYAIREGLAEA